MKLKQTFKVLQNHISFMAILNLHRGYFPCKYCRGQNNQGKFFLFTLAFYAQNYEISEEKMRNQQHIRQRIVQSFVN